MPVRDSIRCVSCWPWEHRSRFDCDLIDSGKLKCGSGVQRVSYDRIGLGVVPYLFAALQSSNDVTCTAPVDLVIPLGLTSYVYRVTDDTNCVCWMQLTKHQASWVDVSPGIETFTIKHQAANTSSTYTAQPGSEQLGWFSAFNIFTPDSSTSLSTTPRSGRLQHSFNQSSPVGPKLLWHHPADGPSSTADSGWG